MSQGWTVNATTGEITFNEAPATGTNNIAVSEYASADINATAIWSIGSWNAEYGYPGEVEFFSDRLVFASTTDQPQTLWLSRIGDYSFFGKSTPILDDDAIQVTMNARRLNAVVDLLPKQHLLALTTGGVWKIGGGDSEVLTPSTIATRPQPSSGAGALPALDVGETAVYLTHKSGQVRDLAFTFEADGYAGSDLTAFSAHLLRTHTLTDWTFAQEPWSAVFAVRDDGTLLCMTYKREHQVVAWGRHTTEGTFQNTCSVSEERYHGTYVVVERTVNGSTVQYLERFADPVDDAREHAMLDCSLAYDGRNTTGTTLTITGGETPDTLAVITASASTFAASNVGDEVVLDYDGEPCRITISAHTSATQVEGYPSRALVAADLSPGTDWALAVDSFSGLGHLEGLTVEVFGDGYDRGEFTVSSGAITGVAPSVLAIVGIPYESDFESLDMTVIGGESVATRNKVIRELGILVQDTNSISASAEGFDYLNDYQPRDAESMSLPAELRTEWLNLNVTGSWVQNPRVYIRAKGPAHATVLAIEPKVGIGT